jgi:urea transport system substrate-binding protein
VNSKLKEFRHDFGKLPHLLSQERGLMVTRFNRRKFLVYGSATLGTSMLLKACGGGTTTSESTAPSGTDTAAGGGDTVQVGILHSLSGTMAISETTVVDAEMLAIKEINAAGGVLGKQIEAIQEDGASDWPTFAEKAEKLIDQDKVAVVFGGWTSASRKAMLPVFESKDHMLWYPIQYEGQECSKNIFYTGAAPNQQIEPAVDWLLANKGKEFFLVGSDYVFPRTANTIIKEQLKVRGGKTVGEDYLPLGNTEVTPIITKIKAALPNGGVIFNSLNGDSNVAFFKQLQGAGLTPDKYPTMSVSIAEEEVRQIGKEFLLGQYASWNYFQTVDSPENTKWVADFKAEFGDDRVTNDPMEAAYIMVYLWKQAVEKAGTFDIPAVRTAAYGQEMAAPGGPVKMFPNHHISKTVRIGQVRDDGLFDIVEATPGPVDPVPWNQFVPDTKGFACDWSDPAKGGKFKM